MSANKYAGRCVNCGSAVAAQAGRRELTRDGWRVYCALPCERVPAGARKASVTAQVGNLSGILALFDRARKHLKFPAVVLGVPGFEPIRINVAGERARVPGSLTVVAADKDDRGVRRWFGRVKLDGAFEASWELATQADYHKAVETRLVAFAADPAKVGGEDGRLHGRCCFCRLPLSDPRSTVLGYGKKCASNFGLPWGGERHAFAAGEVAA